MEKQNATSARNTGESLKCCGLLRLSRSTMAKPNAALIKPVVVCSMESQCG